MKYFSLIFSILVIILLSACGGNGSESYAEVISTPPLNGIFSQNNDTLKVTAKTDNFGKTIDFDITATRTETVKTIFNEALLIDQSSKMEHYRLKNWISADSSYVAYELINFTYYFENDSWTVADTIIITDHNATLPKFTNLGGTYNRVN